MKSKLFGMIAVAGSLVVSTAAFAQSPGFWPLPSSNIVSPPMGDAFASTAASSPYFRRDVPAYTPTMERQRLATMIALREELSQLRAADGGTLSNENRDYLTRKANRLLARR